MDFKHLPHSASVPGETRQQALQDPGFGKLFTDHMVVIDFDAGRQGIYAGSGFRVSLEMQVLQ